MATICGVNFDDSNFHAFQLRDDGIPILTIEVVDGFMTFAKAVEMGKKVLNEIKCPVHFKSLKSQSISFYIFDESVKNKTYWMDECGTETGEWLEAMQQT